MPKQTLSAKAEKVKKIVDVLEASSNREILKIIDSVLYLIDYDEIKKEFE